MGRPWNIAIEDDERSAERWRPLMTRGGCERLVLPIGRRGDYLRVECAAGQFTSNRYFDNDMTSEIWSLDTSDMSWDDVELVLGVQMIFLPVLGVELFSYTGPGFEPGITVGGLDRLFGRGFGSQLDIELHTAARLASYHHFAIEVKH